MIHQALIRCVVADSKSSASHAAASDLVKVPTVIAGFADRNANLFRRIGLPLGDPAAWVELPSKQQIGIVRDLEMDRVRAVGNLDRVFCAADFPPPTGDASGDRETAVAASVAECLKQQNFNRVRTDRSLPMIFAWHLAERGIEIAYDDELGVIDRRSKTQTEIESLRQAQSVTEDVMREICETIAGASVNEEGLLLTDGITLTSERVRTLAATAFMQRGFSMTHGAIVASVPHAADCHHAGTGPLRSGVPIIVDLFPRDDSSRYNGDCTRTVVHGTATPEVIAMHDAVVRAKAACEAMLVPGNTAEAAHLASENTLIESGYAPSRGTLTDEPSIQHGTGHGIGLEVHEPILLDVGGGTMLDREVFTVEPGLYGRRVGGVRVEDMVVVTRDGPENLNQLHQGLNWI